ncbi:malonate transporter subunit MadL [Vibrio sp. S17_S38]|uniref:malonate transporter subunit MadL n=1 Tax=Vibrio sp. S17_S38 TaxID=2720229 RepID=UPI001680CD7C|nr:malonate transporter subunit MadL [Vibrio sp. S17_S38]MBD1573368.1 malonate transporter subunit MadL [Vibrio sp. S17_S38]
MIIFGTALLAICTLAGVTIGSLLGKLIGIPANVGGIGIAMLILIFVGNYLKSRDMLQAEVEKGITFWSAIYIPVVVAMAAKQNVFGAVSGGTMAITAGVVAVALGFILVPILSNLAKNANKSDDAKNATLPKNDSL